MKAAHGAKEPHDPAETPHEAEAAEPQDTRAEGEPVELPAAQEPQPASEAEAQVADEPAIAEIVDESEEIAGLKTDLAKARADLDAVKDKALRFAAELDNTRKRMRRDIDEARKRGREEVLREFLPVFDALDFSLKQVEENDANRSILEGVRLVQRQFLSGMSQFGLQKFDSKGQPFDPQRHEAVSQAPADDMHPPGAIIEELSKGYLLGEILLRPAQVVVATAPAPKKDTPESGEAKAQPDEGGEVTHHGE